MQRWTQEEDLIVRTHPPEQAAKATGRTYDAVLARRRILGATVDQRSRQMNDLRGKRFGRLSVRHFAGIYGGHAYWCCLCDCGQAIKVRGSKLACGRQVSCGCARADADVRKTARCKVDPELRKAIAAKGAKAKERSGKPAKPKYSMTIDQAATSLGVTRERVEVLVADGVFASREQRNGRVMLARQDVEAMAEMCSIPLLHPSRCKLSQDDLSQTEEIQ